MYMFTFNSKIVFKYIDTVYSLAGRYGFSLCFDNVNQKLTVRHQTRDKNNKMFNMVQAYAARDRIPSNNLNDNIPSPQDILDIPLQSYLPSEKDESDLRSEVKTMIIRTIWEYFPAFHQLHDMIEWNIDHQYSRESAKKSNMVILNEPLLLHIHTLHAIYVTNS